MTLCSVFMRWGFALAVMIAMALLLTPWQGSATTQLDGGKSATNESLPGQPFRDWLEALRDEAHRDGISEATLDAALKGITPVKRVIELDRFQPEFTKTFWTYLRQHVNEEKIKRGRALLRKHSDLLNEIHAAYGIPPRYLISLWGMETNFGDNLGSFRVINALVTLAYDKRRAHHFRLQLLDALQIIEEGHISAALMKGSWAGAMGHMQFLPSTFIRYAVDYTGNGHKDIWGSLPDAFASAANYLSNIGWRSEEIWGREVRLPEEFDLRSTKLNRKKTIEEWSALGVRRSDGLALSRVDMEGSILLPQGHKGPAFLVYNNFHAIMSWNRSINFAISVGHLADRIVGFPKIAFGRQAEHEPLSRDEIEEIQHLLNRHGFDAGAEDGLPGPITSAGIRAFQDEFSLPPDGYPSLTVLQHLRALSAPLD